MKISLFGATGRTGSQIIDQGLALGHEITAFARTPSKITTQHERLRVIPGTLGDTAAVEEAVAGQEVVISALGSSGLSLTKRTTLYTQSGDALLPALQRQGIQRFLVITAGLAQRGKLEGAQFFVNHLFKPLFWRTLYVDMAELEEQVRQSNLNWTIVRPARLTNGPLTRMYRLAKAPATLERNRTVSRADLAHFILRESVENQFMKSTVYIAD